MTREFFVGCTTVEEVKQRFRKLAFQHHPDVGGDTATMQRLNAEYHDILSSLNGQTRPDPDTGKDWTYYYNEETEQAVMDKIYELIGLQLPSIEILLVGTWIWVQGDTRPVKESLKAAGLRWHGKRGRWYWRRPQNRSRYNKRASFSGICERYGVKSFSSETSGTSSQLA